MQHILTRLTALSIAAVGILGFWQQSSAAAWYEQSSGVSAHLYAVDFGGASAGIAVGASGTVLYTTNKGATWTQGTSGVLVDLRGVDMTSSTIGYAVGGGGVILKTTDGGATWSSIGGLATMQTLYDIKMYSSTIGYAVGGGGVILKTTDGGGSWNTQTSGVTETLYGVDMYNASYVYAAGANGTAVKTSNGSTWTVLNTTVADHLYDIDVINTTIVHVVGADRTSLKTTNGGTVWASTTAAGTMTADAVGVLAYNSSNIIALGSDATASQTTDGSTYTSLLIDGANVQRDLAWYAISLIWSVGDNGTIWAYDGAAPNVDDITPTIATSGSNATFSVTYSDDSGVTGCAFYYNGTNEGAMTLDASATSGTATITYAPLIVETASAYAVCTDAAGNSGTGTTTSIIVSAAAEGDTTAPTVGTITPTTATEDSAVTLSATYSDEVGVASCTLYVDGEETGAMTLASGTASRSHTFAATGTASVYVRCADAAGNIGNGSITSVAIAAASSDTTAPTVGTITPLTATQNTAVTLSATASDSGGLSTCRLYVNGSDQGAMTASSDTYSRSHTFATSGSNTAYASCTDLAGNATNGTSVTVAVSAVSVTVDTTAPTVGAVSPSTATVGTAVMLSVSVEDSGGISSCVLYVNGTLVGNMDVDNGYATYSYTFSESGTVVGNAYCTDAAGYSTRGDSTTFTVSADEEIYTEDSVSSAIPGSLLKLPCSTGADVNDICRAVYYYDTDDEKRHAFPNEKVFFSWYADFGDVVVVTADFMASLTLGSNITYHPGYIMVKFTTVDTVYCVGSNGELRAVDSEATAIAIYGSTWNQQIHDISDAFYGNYDFGTDIDEASDYDPDEVYADTDHIEDIL